MKRKFVFIIISVLLTSSAIILQFTRNYPDACDTYAELGIKGEVSSEINKMLSSKLSKNNAIYNKIATLDTQSDGSISAITVDASTINIIALDFSSEIYNSISNINTKFELPLGNAMGSKFFSGKGPKIKLNIIPVGASEFDIKSELISSGINQTLHRISITFKTEIICLAPYHEHKSFLETKIILVETLIVGKIPEIILQR